MTDQYIRILQAANRPGLTLYVREAEAEAICEAIKALELMRTAAERYQAGECSDIQFHVAIEASR